MNEYRLDISLDLYTNITNDGLSNWYYHIKKNNSNISSYFGETDNWLVCNTLNSNESSFNIIANNETELLQQLVAINVENKCRDYIQKLVQIGVRKLYDTASNLTKGNVILELHMANYTHVFYRESVYHIIPAGEP